MARRRHSNSRGSSSNRRRLFWARTCQTFSITPNNRAQPIDLLYAFQQAYGADLFGFTVTRIVGHVTHWSMGGSSSNAAYTYSSGIRVDDQNQWTSTDTDARQLALVPYNDPYSDWMWVRNSEGYATTGTASADAVWQQQKSNRVELDLRAQRRLDELGQTLFWIHGVPEDLPTATSLFAFTDVNVLCKRP